MADNNKLNLDDPIIIPNADLEEIFGIVDQQPGFFERLHQDGKITYGQHEYTVKWRWSHGLVRTDLRTDQRAFEVIHLGSQDTTIAFISVTELDMNRLRLDLNLTPDANSLVNKTDVLEKFWTGVNSSLEKTGRFQDPYPWISKLWDDPELSKKFKADFDGIRPGKKASINRMIQLAKEGKKTWQIAEAISTFEQLDYVLSDSAIDKRFKRILNMSREYIYNKLSESPL